MTITDTMKEYMQENNISYEDVAKRTGWSRQNVWDKLNKRNESNIETVKRLADALGFSFSLEKLEEPERAQDAATLFEALEMEQISYSTVEKVLNLVGYSLKSIPPEK